MKICVNVIIFFLISYTVTAQNIDNVRFEQEGRKVNIYYDITGAKPNWRYRVKVYVSTDGGTTFSKELKSVSGDAGENIKPGKDKKIVWEGFKDIGEIESDKIAIKVMAKEIPKVFRLQAGIKGSLYFPQNSNFNQDYGSIFNYGADVALLHKSGFGLRLDIDYIRKNSIKPDDYYDNLIPNDINILPISLDIIYKTPSRKYYTYYGIGPSIYLLKQDFTFDYNELDNSIQNKDYISQTCFGFNLLAGVSLQKFFAEIKCLFTSFHVDYIYYDHLMNKQDYNYGLGGTNLSVGYRF